MHQFLVQGWPLEYNSSNMAGEERGKFKLTPKDALTFLSDLTDFIRDTEKDELERQRLLKTTETDETLREIISIASDTAATVKLLTKVQEMLPPIIDLYAEYATQDEFEQFLLDFDIVIDRMQSELEAREQRLTDINVGME